MFNKWIKVSKFAYSPKMSILSWFNPSKKLFSGLFLFLFSLTGLAYSADSLNILTFNIRFYMASDGENAWPNRKQMVFDLVRFHKADIIGFQEVLPDQWTDLEAEFSEFDLFGSGRDDGLRKGEATVLAIKKERFSIVKSGHFFLSETPEKVSPGWDAAFARPTCWAVVQDKLTQKTILLINTHFDHVGTTARKNSGKQIADFINHADKNVQVILTGDFNTTLPSGELDGLKKSAVKPAQELFTGRKYGTKWSFQGFGLVQEKDRQLIDYVFLSPDWKVDRMGVLPDSWNGKWPSDHCPVLVEVK
ncbi:MAG: endonuclease/exonuclease/phosphatase family protein [Candidatus Riflebacteria bacterium]|nr:endonuclease/exonuclease/phosphatase family protein [Candidatus Riflebacteria bacterium]